MKKIFVSLFIVCLLLSFTALLNAQESRDFQGDSERRYKSSSSSYDHGQYRSPRKVRRVYRRTYKIPRGIHWRDLKKIRKYQRKIDKLRWRITHRPMSRYRYLRYERKIRKYRYKIDRILMRYRPTCVGERRRP